ncbi:flagellar assembly protein FliH [Spirochaetia bacterium]|nr:flagellar assembly protein FliH [Spirochaetia bacterium]
MAKAVFRPGEITLNGPRIVLEPPTSYPEMAHLAPEEDVVESAPAIEEYTGPTADDLRREADAFKVQWEAEREGMIGSAKAEADRIAREARDAASRETAQKTEEARGLKGAAEAEAEKILAGAKQKAAELEEESRATIEAVRKEAEEQGRSAGREEGFAEGKAEADRLVERVQTVLERAQSQREEILQETEQQIVDLVLLMTRKVIKIISETQKDVVRSNVTQALRKVKGRGNILIRVNMADVKLTTEHINSFIQKMEGVKGIQVAEDSTVDPGGCIIETDFGEIDARISSQLAELETKILEISPIRTKPKSTNGGGAGSNSAGNGSAGGGAGPAGTGAP